MIPKHGQGVCVAFKFIVAVFSGIQNPDVRIVGTDPVLKTGDPVGVAEHAGGAGDDACADRRLSHQVHEAGSGLAGAVEVAAHVGQSGGIFNIRIGGDNGNAPGIQLVDLIADGGIVAGGEDDAGRTVCCHFFYGGQLGVQIETDAGDGDTAVVLFKLPGLFLHA